MEIVSIEKKTFEEMKERFGCFSRHVKELCARYRPPGKMNWMDGALEEGMRYIDTVTAHFRPAMNGEVYFTGEDVCRMLHITSRTLQGYRTQRLIPYISLPGKTLYRQSDLLRMLEENYVDMRQKRKRGKSPT